MARKISFIVWNKVKKEWVHGREYGGCHLFGTTILLGDFMNGVDLSELNHCVPLQSIERQDKNGVHIFEGDILKNPSGWVEIIEWGRNCGCCGDVEGFILPGSFKDLELIGNIHSDPELIPDHYKHLR